MAVGAPVAELQGFPNAGAAECQGAAAEAERCKKLGGEAYARKEWAAAADLYTQALDLCGPSSELALTCLNNRAACHSQLKDYPAVIQDASQVLARQPANVKALLRRMVAYDALGRASEALEDASSVLTMEPKNAHATAVIDKKRKSLAKTPTNALPRCVVRQALSVLLFSEDRPLHCYACLRSLQKHLQGAAVDVHVCWQATDSARLQSYQLLQALPETSRFAGGSVSWVETSNGQLFQAFSRIVNRLSVEGKHHVMLLSDTALFHSAVDVAAACRVLTERREAFAVRLDLNPRVDWFPDEGLLASAPSLKCFAGDERLLLWTRAFDKSKPAYQSVPREAGWDAILDWTATIVRAEHVQHFFSALLPPLNTSKELDDKAADWLSRRQRMKQSEISHRSACFRDPLLITVDAAAFGDAASCDRALRWHLLRTYGADGSRGADAMSRLARQVGWKLPELMGYFQGVDAADEPAQPLGALLAPEAWAPHYLSSARAPLAVPPCGLPRALSPPGPLVSWLVPARNAEFFLAGCFASIQGQRGLGPGGFEVVFVEDASEDGTLRQLRRLADDHAEVRLVEHESQLGVAGAIAAGWRQCRGDFVARLDADDEAEPDRLLKQLRYMEQHPSISVLGGRVRSFWTEQRKCSIERLTEKADGRVAVAAWREFHGSQTSRLRELFSLRYCGGELLVEDSSAEYAGCRVLRVGDRTLPFAADGWRAALRDVEGGLGEVLLERRDPLEPPAGSRALHPLLLRAALVVEDPIAGTTALWRRGHFAEGDCPFKREEAEGHWALLGLEAHRHAANLADPLVRARRHDGNRAQRQASGIYESSCAAAQHALKCCGVQADMQDAAALLHFRGPRSADQGERLLEALERLAEELLSRYARPGGSEHGGAFWADFVQGREAALERALLAQRLRFRALVEERSKVITSADSPRHSRRRTPPR